MKKIPTAKQFADQYDWDNSSLNIEELLRDFAKLHVKAALKEALESIPCLGSSTDIASYDEVEEAVLNAYPDDLIQ